MVGATTDHRRPGPRDDRWARRPEGPWPTTTDPSPGTTPTLSNTVTDGDGDTANLTFEVYTIDANGNPKDQVKLTDPDTGKPAAYGVVVSSFVTSGGTASTGGGPGASCRPTSARLGRP
ncbi:hypothetical protein [Streptomyces sp. NPDC004296]|uniref:hypothetical protein n=1 Tax=Streptomyces sp. NPDC004296 TaxID=3364697 RepID=UPI003686648B